MMAEMTDGLSESELAAFKKVSLTIQHNAINKLKKA
jgi:hypothetical protein